MGNSAVHGFRKQCTAATILLLLICIPILNDSFPRAAAGTKDRSRPTTASPSADAPDKSADAELDEPGPEFRPEIDEDLTALVVPANRLEKIEKARRLEYLQALRGLLLEGISANGGPAARKYFETTQRVVGGDPRAAYAYGLAYCEQNNFKDALPHFRTAARQANGLYLPARQAAAWIEISRRNYEAGFSDLTELARHIEHCQESWPTERDRAHTAEWLGRITGFLAGPGAPPEQAAKVDALISSLENTLSGERRLAFGQGRQSIRKRQQELEAIAARPVGEIVREMQEKLEEAKAAVHLAGQEIERLETKIRDARQPFDRRIADASLAIRTNSQKARAAAHDIPDAEEQVAYWSVPQQKATGVTRYRGVPTGVRVRNETAQEKKAREAKLTSAQQKLQQLKTSQDNARQAMADARKDRERAQAELRQVVAARQGELRDARQKKQACAARLRDAEHAVLSPEQIKNRVSSLEAYLSLDPAQERDRLLATLKTD